MENIIQELSDIENLSCKLVSKDGTSYDVPRNALSRCPFFEEVFKKKLDSLDTFVDISNNSSIIFQDFLKGVECNGIDDVFEIMAFACKIEWEDFQVYCARAANDIVVPDEISADTIISVVGALVRFLPVRTSVQYARLVDKCCRRDDRLRHRLFESVKTILNERKSVAYAPLDIPFFKKEATVALLENIEGQNITAILHEGKWLPVNLFGSQFCPFEAQVKQFHLSLGQYVVYQTSSGRVLTKDLLSDACPKVIFENSTFFSSRCNQLLVISKNGTTNREGLFEWNDQTREFVMKFSHPKWELTSARRNFAGHLIVVLQDEFVINVTTEKSIAVIPGERYDTDYPNGCICVVDDEKYTIGAPAHDDEELSETDQEETENENDQEETESENDQEETENEDDQEEVDHFGYNILETCHVEKGFYETISCRPKDLLASGDLLGQKSNLHGRVIAVSDVLLV